ncbi:hypothetical protein SAMN04488096_105160 [Mesonia phycicola]|uniref:Uncharacterized protein n=1 Tax=Mesonia phycicola TaxID=579105 RepID=A0A1M6EMA8_9FLAO|nr:hypothetical protein [Mesonia phycicola]SHI86657.1 hypothetical protein SAMN04488096_105160 [Mesonia phycicola]
MKNIYLMLLTVCVAISSISCDSDDDNGNTSDDNYLMIDGVNYELESGVIYDYGVSYEGGSYNFDIILTDTDVVTSEDGVQTPEDTVFNTVYFELWSDNADDLSTGTYSYEGTADSDAFTYTNGEIEINYNIENGDADSYHEIISGDVVISENGSTYEISFEGTTEDGSEVSLFYRGSLITN